MPLSPPVKRALATAGSSLCFMSSLGMLFLADTDKKSLQITALTVGIGLFCSSIALGIYAHCGPSGRMINVAVVGGPATPLVSR